MSEYSEQIPDHEKVRLTKLCLRVRILLLSNKLLTGNMKLCFCVCYVIMGYCKLAYVDPVEYYFDGYVGKAQLIVSRG